MSESLKDKYGAFFAQGQRLRKEAEEGAIPRLRKRKVPRDLWPLLPYAAFWGIDDEAYRDKLVNAAPAKIWKDFRKVVSQYEDSLVDWLGGPEADERDTPPTPEYLAFAFMLQAFYWPRD